MVRRSDASSRGRDAINQPLLDVAAEGGNDSPQSPNPTQRTPSSGERTPLLNRGNGPTDAATKGTNPNTPRDSGPESTTSSELSLSNVCHEIVDLLRLAVPIFVAMVAYIGMKTTDTALTGHVGSKYLDATSYSDLWTQSTGVLVMGRVLNIFASQAYGAENFKLVGTWLQISLIVTFSISIIVYVAWGLTGPALEAFGVSKTYADPAWYYAVVLLACLPARIINSQLNQFLQSQRIMYPSVVAAICAVVLNLAFGIVFVLGIPFDPNPSSEHKGFGFKACPIVTMSIEYLQLFIILFYFCYIKQLHAKCWHKWDWSEIRRERLVKYVKMYVPAMLSIGSDFWRVAVIGIVAATLGDDELGVFNSSYRILWICLTLIGSLASAVGIKLGNALGKGRADLAKFSTTVGLILAFLLLVILALIVAAIPRQLGQIFSSDEKILSMYDDIRVPLALVMLLMNFSVALERVPMMMGRTRAVMIMSLVGSWVGQVPGVFLCTKLWRDDLVGLFYGMAFGYALLVCLYMYLVIAADWETVALEALERSERRGSDAKLSDDLPTDDSAQAPAVGIADADETGEPHSGAQHN